MAYYLHEPQTDHSQQNSGTPEASLTVSFPPMMPALSRVNGTCASRGGSDRVSEKCAGRIASIYRVAGRTAYACDHLRDSTSIHWQGRSSRRASYFASGVVSGYVPDGIDSLRNLREADSARNRSAYKTAWRIKQIRTPMAEDVRLEGSSVEVDEMYHGGKRKSGAGRPMRGDKHKTTVLGAVERGGRVIARTANDVTAATLHGFVKECVLPKSTVFTAISQLLSWSSILLTLVSCPMTVSLSPRLRVERWSNHLLSSNIIKTCPLS